MLTLIENLLILERRKFRPSSGSILSMASNNQESKKTISSLEVKYGSGVGEADVQSL